VDWITGADLEARLGLGAGDPMAVQQAAAACQLVRRRRSYTADDVLGNDVAVIEGTLRWAALLYQGVNAAAGFAEYDEFGNRTDGYGDAISEIYRLVGSDPVVA
jgi:hypothetical protein